MRHQWRKMSLHMCRLLIVSYYGKFYMHRLALIFLIFCSNAYSQCWEVGDLKGVSAKKGSKYEVSKDGISKSTFKINISGKTSSVTPSSDLKCIQIAANSLTCLYSEDEKGTTETWSVDPENYVAYYTKTNSGFGMFDGAALFVGNIKGLCK